MLSVRVFRLKPVLRDSSERAVSRGVTASIVRVATMWRAAVSASQAGGEPGVTNVSLHRGKEIATLMRPAISDMRVKWLCAHACVCNWLSACLPGFYGASCAQRCQCQAGVSCHHETGSCGCPAGLTGPGCEKSKREKRIHLSETLLF